MQKIADHFLEYYRLKKLQGEESCYGLHINEVMKPNAFHKLQEISTEVQALLDTLQLDSEATKEPQELPKNEYFKGVNVLVPLPVLTLFVETSPTSFVPVSPKVNHRSIDRQDYHEAFGVEKGTSLVDVLQKTYDSSFQRMSVVCFPYEVITPPHDSLPCLESFATRRKDRKVLTIQVPNKTYTFVTKKHFDQALKIFGSKTCAVINWEYFFKKIGCEVLSTGEHIDNLIDQMGVPRTIYKEITTRRTSHPEATTYADKLDCVCHFIQMCTPVRFSFPEGQHRIEATTRVLYGYDLTQDYLIEKKGVFDINPQNTVFQNISTFVLSAIDEAKLKEKDTWQNSVCFLLQDISTAVTKESAIVFHSSYRETFSTFIQQTLKGLHKLHKPGHFTEDKWYTFNLAANENKQLPSRRTEVLQFQRTLFLALVKFLLNHNPYMQELKDVVSFQQVQDLLNNDGWKWWPGSSAWAFRNPFSIVSFGICGNHQKYCFLTHLQSFQVPGSENVDYDALFLINERKLKLQCTSLGNFSCYNKKAKNMPSINNMTWYVYCELLHCMCLLPSDLGVLQQYYNQDLGPEYRKEVDIHDPTWIAIYILMPAESITRLLWNEYCKRNGATVHHSKGTRNQGQKTRFYYDVKRRYIAFFMKLIEENDLFMGFDENKWRPEIERALEMHAEKIDPFIVAYRPRGLLEVLLMNFPAFIEEYLNQQYERWDAYRKASVDHKTCFL